MPYIEQRQREQLDDLIVDFCIWDLSEGELNYLITRIIDRWCVIKHYSTFNSAMGVLECVKQEFYRRIVASYEDKKCAENGDVY